MFDGAALLFSARASRVTPYNARSRVPARDWIHSREHPTGIPRLPTRCYRGEDVPLLGGGQVPRYSTRHDFYGAREKESEGEGEGEGDRCYAMRVLVTSTATAARENRSAVINETRKIKRPALPRLKRTRDLERG